MRREKAAREERAELRAEDVNWKIRQACVDLRRERTEIKFLMRHGCERIQQLRRRCAPRGMITRVKLDLMDHAKRLDALNRALRRSGCGKEREEE